MSIKILVISNYRVYHSVRPEAEMFIGLAKLGFDITVMTYGDSNYIEEFEKAGIRVIDFHPEKKFNRQEIGRIRKELIDGKYDIMHLFNSESTVNGIRAAKGLPVKIALYRGFVGHIHWYNPGSYIKYLHPRVDMIVCNSSGVEENFHKQLFFNKNKARTIIKGHDIAWYKDNTPLNINKEFHIPENSFVLVNVANNRRMKGIKYLLNMMNFLPEDLPVYLLIVGASMDSPQNLKIINSSNNKDKIILTGYRDDALNIVAASDVYILSSIRGESLNKSVMEAMALGKPAIITDISGNRDLVVHNENGLIVPSRNSKKLAEAVLYMYNHPEQCKQMGLNSRKHIKTRLNLQNAIIQHKELYEELCQKKLVIR